MEKNNKTIILLIALIVLMGVGLVYFAGIYSSMKAESEETQMLLEGERKRLESELGNMKNEYESLKTNNDSMNVKIDEQKEKIERLLKINASNFQKIKLYQEELNTLRDIMKSYVVQIDSLNTRNQILMAENTDVKDKLQTARTENQKLEKEKENLTSKVDVASALSAKDIITKGITRRNNEVERVSKIDKLRACFTIRENAVAEAGEKTFYVRITRPDNLLLASSNEEMFDFEDQKLACTAKRSIQYENKDIEVCVFWENNKNLIAGSYTVDIFCDGKLIGSNTFSLK